MGTAIVACVGSPWGTAVEWVRPLWLTLGVRGGPELNGCGHCGPLWAPMGGRSKIGAAIVAHFGSPWGAGVNTVKWVQPLWPDAGPDSS